jgi:FRG domain
MKTTITAKTETIKIETHTSETLSDYIKYIANVKAQEETNGNKSDIIFRGQTHDQDLVPKLVRQSANGDTRAIEKLVITEFKRIAIPYLNNLPRNDWEWIALAQHYGLPTRFLDWSFSSLSALWFAVEKQVANVGSNSIVYLFKPLLEDYNKVDGYQSPFDIDYTVIYRPPQIDKRIIAQQGLFTAHLLKENGMVVKFNNHKNYKRKLVKIIIPSNKRYSIRKELAISGVNPITQYPDLSGVCQFLSQRYFRNLDE